MDIAADGIENHFRSLALANPVALHFLEGIGPVQIVETVQEAAGICRHTELPLCHLLLLDREAATHGKPVLYFVVSQDGAQSLAPVDRGFSLICNAIAHQDIGFLLGGSRLPHLGSNIVVAGGLELGNQFGDGARLVHLRVVPALEHAQESPLGPFVVVGIAGAERTVPVEGEAYAVQLLAVAGHVHACGLFRMLAGLDGILLRGQAECVVSHGMKHVETLQTLVARIDVARYISQRMAHVQTGPGGIGEHVQNVEFGFGRIFLRLVSLLLSPALLPLFLDTSEIVIHIFYFFAFFNLNST